MKSQPVSWEKTFANHISSKRLIFKIYKKLIQFNGKMIRIINNHKPIKKRTKDLNRHFFQRRHQDEQRVHENMLNITNHQQNVN